MQQYPPTPERPQRTRPQGTPSPSCAWELVGQQQLGKCSGSCRQPRGSARAVGNGRQHLPSSSASSSIGAGPWKGVFGSSTLIGRSSALSLSFSSRLPAHAGPVVTCSLQSAQWRVEAARPLLVLLGRGAQQPCQAPTASSACACRQAAAGAGMQCPSEAGGARKPFLAHCVCVHEP